MPRERSAAGWFYEALDVPIAGTVHAAEPWLPTTLASAPADLLVRTHPLGYYLPTLAVTVAAGAAGLAVAALRLRAREI